MHGINSSLHEDPHDQLCWVPSGWKTERLVYTTTVMVVLPGCNRAHHEPQPGIGAEKGTLVGQEKWCSCRVLVQGHHDTFVGVCGALTYWHSAHCGIARLFGDTCSGEGQILTVSGCSLLDQQSFHFRKNHSWLKIAKIARHAQSLRLEARDSQCQQ